MAAPARSLEELQAIARQMREDVISMLVQAGSGHSAGPLGLADFFAAFFFAQRIHDPANPTWEGRDRFVLSAGHLCPILYVAMARSGYFPVKELATLRKLGTRLQGHPSRTDLPSIEFACGSLGQGVGASVGMALAARMDKKKHMTYVLGSDGEMDEGSVWEALMFAGSRKLSNFCYIVDRNNIQIDGNTEDVMPLEPVRDKLEAFGYFVRDVDGHNIRDIIAALEEARAIFERPMAIILHTIPGKGVDFMEQDYVWHGKPPDKEQAKEALRQLRSLNGRMVCSDCS